MEHTDREPYRATKLWNEVITAFQTGMPLKKHRRLMQAYTNCFIASDAVTWLHCYLLNNTNFGLKVTRVQTVNLLQKFLKCHVIESAISAKKRDFCDDSHLYRFTIICGQISKPSALCMIQSPAMKSKDVKKTPSKKSHSDPQKENLPHCFIMERKLSPEEESQMWRRIFTSRLEKLLPPHLLSDYLDEKLVNGFIIKHNSTRLSKTGVVCLVDKTDDIPQWVISAMKCLANWPNASGSGSCLPNYPGFEKDVFKVVSDFFLNLRVPLLPNKIETLLFAVFCHFQSKNISRTPKHPKSSNDRPNTNFKNDDIKTSTPNNVNTSMSTSDVHSSTVHGQLLLDDPTAMWEYPSATFFETDFANSDPITRIVSASSLSKKPLGSFGINEDLYQCNASGISCGSKNCGLHSIAVKPDLSHNGSRGSCGSRNRSGSYSISVEPNSQHNGSTGSCGSRNRSGSYGIAIGSDLPHHQRCNSPSSSPIAFIDSDQPTVMSQGDSGLGCAVSTESISTISMCSYKTDLAGQSMSKSPLKAWSSNMFLQDEVKDSLVWQMNDLYVSARSGGHHLNQSLSLPENLQEDLYVCEINDLDLSNLSSRTILQISDDDEVDSPEPKQLSRCNTVKRNASCSKIPNSSYLNKSLNRSMQRKLVYPDELKSSFQLILLLLPSANRRQLHLLLRLLNKIVKNGKFILKVKSSMREFLLDTFLPAIVTCDREQKYPMMQMVSFLLDHCESLFSVPEGLQLDVGDLSRSCFGRIKYFVDEPGSLSYCEMVSKQRYEDQRNHGSAHALRDLLHNILQDPKMTHKKKRHKIKQFKEIHPDVYYQQFPEKLPHFAKPKQSLLNKLVNMRI